MMEGRRFQDGWNGVMEYWSDGVKKLEYWSRGVMGYWRVGAVV
jgi:hypothetical protein